MEAGLNVEPGETAVFDHDPPNITTGAKATMTRRGRNRIILLLIVSLYIISYIPAIPSLVSVWSGHVLTAAVTPGNIARAKANKPAPEAAAAAPDTAVSGPMQDLAGDNALVNSAAPPLPYLVSSNHLDVLPTANTGPQSETETPADAVTTGEVRIRLGPGTVYGEKLTLPGNQPVNVIGRHGDWLLVGQGGTVSGWVMRNSLVILPGFDVAQISDVTPPELSRHDATLNVTADIRTGPGEIYPVAAPQVPANTRINVAGRVVNNEGDSEWVLIADEQGFAGWLPLTALSLRAGFNMEDVDVIELPPPVTVDVFEWGGQSHDLVYAGLMQDMGMTWIKLQYKWRPDGRPVDVENMIARAHQAGLKILLAVPGDPYPEQIDYSSYVTFLRGVAALDPAPDAIEVWNEMNIDFEWPEGEINPDIYVKRMLAPAYTAIKEENPNIMVISGALAPTGFDNGRNAWSDFRYLEGMVAAGAMNYLDCVGVHYNAGATSPYATSGHPAGDYYGWYYLPSLAMYYQAFGGQRPLCITEIGYLTQGEYQQDLPERFLWAAQTTLTQQGKWLSQAVSLAAESRIVRLLVIFNVNIQYWADGDPQAGYALVRSNGSCPACQWLSANTPVLAQAGNEAGEIAGIANAPGSFAAAIVSAAPAGGSLSGEPGESDTAVAMAAVQQPPEGLVSDSPWTNTDPDYDAGWCGDDVDDGFGWSGVLAWPVNKRTVENEREFRPGHPAIDILMPFDAPVFAAAPGVVVWAGYSRMGGGNMVVLAHGDGWQTSYAHLNAVNVSCGQSVELGEQIGTVGDTGATELPRLRFEVRHRELNYDPLQWLP